jgi:iron complex outermembrane receptor protein
MIKTVFRLTCISLSLLAWTGSSQAAHADPAAQDVGHYVDLSIEDLLNQEVTSANKRAQRLSDVAAAAFVITADDIRESGARSLPEALRLAPGVDVARISADRWAVSIRGFSGFFANKLLVLVDGRSAFTPSFNGVIWNGLQFPLENIERIEVIRGPGGSVWGVNAVNGVVNIITKSARQLQGTRPAPSSRHGMVARWGPTATTASMCGNSAAMRRPDCPAKRPTTPIIIRAPASGSTVRMAQTAGR